MVESHSHLEERRATRLAMSLESRPDFKRQGSLRATRRAARSAPEGSGAMEGGGEEACLPTDLAGPESPKQTPTSQVSSARPAP